MLWTGVLVGFFASSVTTVIYSRAVSRYAYTAFLSPPASLAGAQNFFPEFSTVEKAFVIDDMEWKNSTSWDRDFPCNAVCCQVH